MIDNKNHSQTNDLYINDTFQKTKTAARKYN